MIPKFRAWDKRFSEFVEDFFVSEDGKIYKKSTNTGYGIAISRETSDKVILMQSTGLRDKNGKEIFEGDVVSRNSGMPSVVKFGKWIYEEDFGYKIKNIGFHLDSSYDDDEWFQAMDYEDIRKNYEIIGNVYENPELLEDKE